LPTLSNFALSLNSPIIRLLNVCLSQFQSIQYSLYVTLKSIIIIIITIIIPQVIHILDLIQKYLKLSTKIYQIEYKIILYYVPKYISNQVPKYIRLHTKIV